MDIAILRTRPAKRHTGRMIVLRLGRHLFDMRLAWGLPWEEYIQHPIWLHAHRTKDGVSVYVDVLRFHLRFRYHNMAKRSNKIRGDLPN
jgi:hypothetical protein